MNGNSVRKQATILRHDFDDANDDAAAAATAATAAAAAAAAAADDDDDDDDDDDYDYDYDSWRWRWPWRYCWWQPEVFLNWTTCKIRCALNLDCVEAGVLFSRGSHSSQNHVEPQEEQKEFV